MNLIRELTQQDGIIRKIAPQPCRISPMARVDFPLPDSPTISIPRPSGLTSAAVWRTYRPRGRISLSKPTDQNRWRSNEGYRKKLAASRATARPSDARR